MLNFSSNLSFLFAADLRCLCGSAPISLHVRAHFFIQIVRFFAPLLNLPKHAVASAACRTIRPRFGSSGHSRHKAAYVNDVSHERSRSELEWYGAAQAPRQRWSTKLSHEEVDVRNEMERNPAYVDHLADVEHDFTDIQSRVNGEKQLVEDDRRQRLFVKRKILERKYNTRQRNFELNLLTWEAKCQVRYLAASDPMEWTPQKLSEAFPLSLNAAKKLITDKSVKWRVPRSPEWIQKHDEAVQKRWQELRDLKNSNIVQLRPGFEWLFQEDKCNLLRNAAGIPSLPRAEKNLIENYLCAEKERKIGPFESLIMASKHETTGEDAVQKFVTEYEKVAEQNRSQLEQLNYKELVRIYRNLAGEEDEECKNLTRNAANFEGECETSPVVTLLEMAKRASKQSAVSESAPEKLKCQNNRDASQDSFATFLDDLENQEDVRLELWHRSNLEHRNIRRPLIRSKLGLHFVDKFHFELTPPVSSRSK